MNLLTYWFNPGIYRNTLRRFKWGSVLYAVILFFLVPFVFLTNSPEEMARGYINFDRTIECALFDARMFLFPLLTAFVVPTVVSLLVFNFAHSPKHGIFVHTLPATRTQNYFSTLLAAFTLMFIPVILNGIILLILNACGYGTILGVLNILKWIMINIFILFVMFSVATAASFITGNPFAGAALNIIIHLLPIALYLAISLIGEVFLYGYSYATAPFTMNLITYTPVIWIARNFNGSYYTQEIFSMGATYSYIIMALVFYAIGFVLYKLRKIENCGDVIAFAVAKPIVKYTLTTAAAVAVLGILYGLGFVSWGVAFTVAAVICAIVYFACEMLMGKTLKVWGKYKGFLGFALAIVLVISFCAFTSVFGYETRVPDAQDIAQVSISKGYYEEIPYSDSPEAALAVTQLHKKLLEKRPVVQDKDSYVIDFSYILKNGEKLDREYYVPEDIQKQAMEIMFGYEDYKMAYAGLDILNIDKVDKLNLDIECPNFGYAYALNEDAPAFLKAFKEDMKQISYADYIRTENIMFSVNMSISPQENAEKGMFIADGRSRGYYHFSATVNSSFKNTMEFLKENGYYDLAVSKIAQNMYITKNTVAKSKTLEEEYSYKEIYANYMLEHEAVAKIDSPKDAKALIDEYIKDKESDFVSDETYLVFVTANRVDGFWPGSNIVEFSPENLPDYLRKYVD
ncbi:MAG: hypothetical protein IKC41_02475 [Clostridia bacterium]|nr:hypothetical protein [Clostridia bacterium]MBR2973059.1 hypothetical protein [Clostridia bacterium]